ncbi:GNAT family N-acetyltransferase [Streptomyces sp. NPDC058001]|uniref:GNAT family N-acetyltransferase n=1 Tax=Streptomyces sp. NPDC058001 TaxID=3346300 RepID=UPI0036E68756
MITTSRLTLRRWRHEDIAPLATISGDPEVMRWIGDGSVRSLDGTRAAVEAMERAWDGQGFGLFAVELRESGELVGFTGFSVPEYLPELLPSVEIGWRLGRAYWGQGLATEAALAALRFGLKDRDLDRIVSVAQTGNDASERIMTKLGMRLDRELVDPSCGRPVRVYAVTRAEFEGVGR